MDIISTYRNGNYLVSIYDDGTKIRTTKEDKFVPDFSESCDLTITEYCDGNCKWCYAGCSLEGKHCDFSFYDKLLSSLHPYTELAINGNDLSHPDLIPFLQKMKSQNIIVNMTVNQLHFEREYDKIRSLIKDKLIYGLGISLRNPSKEFISKVKEIPNAVIHVINGVTSPNDFIALMNKGLKILILGYKQTGRGVEWYEADKENIIEKQKWLKCNLASLLDKFKVISFDNLALEQLNVRDFLTEEEWEKFFMGYDSEFTFYINLVQGYFAKNSMDNRHYPIGNMTIDECFDFIRRANEKSLETY